jgi:hypothetical protein
MRKRKARRVGEAVGRSVHDFGNHRQRAYRPRTDTWNEEQLGEVGRTPIRCGNQIGVKARRQHIAWADLVMGRHHQKRLRPRKSHQPRNDAGEIFTTAAAGFTPGFGSVTNRFELETGKPRKFARK